MAKISKTKLEQTRQQGVKRTLVKGGFAIVGMFLFAFALVPIYQILCDITGLNGNTSNLREVANLNIDQVEVDYSREIKMQFVANNHKHAAWEFEPMTLEVKLHPGSIQTFYYRLKNLSGRDMVVQAVPSVSPNAAASYLRKVECFCFTAQPLPAGEETSLFVNMYIHKALPDDVNTMTLAYTLFDISESADFELLTANLKAAGRGAPDPNAKYSTELLEKGAHDSHNPDGGDVDDSKHDH